MPEKKEIRSPADYVRALAAVDPVLSGSLFSLHADLTDEELDVLETLERIEAWEDATFPHAPMTEHEALALWFETAAVPEADAVAVFGSREAMRAVLAGEAPVTGALRSALVSRLGLPLSVLAWPAGWRARRVGSVMAAKAEAGAAVPPVPAPLGSGFRPAD